MRLRALPLRIRCSRMVPASTGACLRDRPGCSLRLRQSLYRCCQPREVSFPRIGARRRPAPDLCLRRRRVRWSPYCQSTCGMKTVKTHALGGDTRDRFNPSLEGLRGLAALMVVVAHALPDEGGFTVGVDVFFVLSGLLITRLVVDELARRGTASLREFYIRRAFRLFPALFVFIVAVLAWTQFLCPGVGTASVHGTLLNSLLYVENWHVIAVAPAATPAFPADPASQAWSLSVEEQFYLLWPVVLIAAWRWKGKRAALIVAACGLVLSLVDIYGLAWFGTTYARVYFGSDTRAAEVLAGCCIALLAQCGW